MAGACPKVQADGRFTARFAQAAENEAHPITIKKFPVFTERSHFTDDTVLTVATAWALLHGTGYAETYRRSASLYRRFLTGGDRPSRRCNPFRAC